MEEASKAREIGEDVDIDMSLMTSPIAESQSMQQSPSDYFRSKAPEMGSLSGTRVAQRVSPSAYLSTIMLINQGQFRFC